MKNLMIAIALIVAMAQTNAQTLNGCFGISFGASQEEVRQMMKEKHSDAELLRDDANCLGYTGGYWADRKAYIWVFSFNNKGQMHTASVSVKPQTDAGIFELYDDVSTDLINKYGSPKSIVERWTYPYSASDKHNFGVTALKLGKAIFKKFWFFQNETISDDDNNAIELKIDDDVYITVKYQDGILINDVVKENAERRKSDM